MSDIKSFSELIGGTPVLELARLADKRSLKARIVAKLEYSTRRAVKDRIAAAMIEDAERRGPLGPLCNYRAERQHRHRACATPLQKAIGSYYHARNHERRAPQAVAPLTVPSELTEGGLGMTGAIKGRGSGKTIPAQSGQFENPPTRNPPQDDPRNLASDRRHR